MEEIVKKTLIHLLKVEEGRQNLLHKTFNKNCKLCKELKFLLRELEGRKKLYEINLIGG